jgi:hypothetical protein
VLTGLALARIAWPWFADSLAGAYLAGMAILSVFACPAWLARSLRQQAAEEEFSRWFAAPPGQALVFRDGWWIVENPH